MEAYKKLFELTEKKIPWALARFNDGEMMGVAKPGVTVARGDQKVTRELSYFLQTALSCQLENYWKGLPCEKCYPDWRYLADKYTDGHDYLTLAVVQTNRNWHIWRDEFPVLIRDRRIIWVSGKDQNITKLPFDVHDHIMLETKNAWADYEDTFKALYENVHPHDMVMFSCGPTAEVLVHRLFKLGLGATYIDIGSTYDPFTRNVWHKCHKGTLPKCEVCN